MYLLHLFFLSLFNDVLFYNDLNQVEFPLIQFFESFLRLPFFPNGVPLWFISMVCFAIILNLLTLKMTQHYFTGFGFKASEEISPTVLAENDFTTREAELVRYVVCRPRLQ